MTVQEGKSKDRMVRLEPFFRETTVATGAPSAGGREAAAPEPQENEIQAALEAGRAAAAVASKRTETRFETPDSSIVTP